MSCYFLQLGHLQLQSLHLINSYASQLADRPSARFPPPVVSQRYQDVIIPYHTGG